MGLWGMNVVNTELGDSVFCGVLLVRFVWLFAYALEAWIYWWQGSDGIVVCRSWWSWVGTHIASQVSWKVSYSSVLILLHAQSNTQAWKQWYLSIFWVGSAIFFFFFFLFFCMKSSHLSSCCDLMSPVRFWVFLFIYLGMERKWQIVGRARVLT